MIAVSATAATSLLTVYFLGKGSGGSDFGEEVLTNSTIESEEKKNVSTWFYFDFENGNIALLSILACELLLFIVSVGCCFFFCGCPCFGCRRCKRTRENFYREHYYASRHQINNANRNNTTEVIEMISREDNRYEYYKGHYYANKLKVNNKNEHDRNNGTNQQYETPQ